MVVAVLITSCQVSEKWNIGPVAAQATMLTKASKKAQGEPTAIAMVCAQNLNHS